MEKKRVFKIVIVIIIFSLFLTSWAYISMNGLPWKIKQTEITAHNYMSVKYPQLKYKIDKTYFNSKMGYYYCRVITEEKLPIKFEVIVRDKNAAEDNYIKNKVDIEAKNIVISLIKNSIPTINNISVLSDAGGDAIEGSYDKYTSFVPGNAYPLKIDMLWSDKKMSLESFIDKALSIRQILTSKNISVCGLYIQDETNGYVITLNGRIKNGKMEGNYNYTKAEIINSKIAYKIK